MPPEDPSFRPLDPGRINATDPVELQYWSQELQCSVTELEDVIDHVGEHTTAVREELARRAAAAR